MANTDAAPVNCSNVNILLSIDGGATFSVILASGTANDGTEDITVPSVNTDEARIKVESAGNIFFDINNADFSIKSVLPVTWLSFTAEKLNSIAVVLKWNTVNEQNNDRFIVERSADAVHFTEVGTVKAGNNTSRAQEYNYADYKAISGTNYYRLKQVNKDGHSSYSAIAKVIFAENDIAWSIRPNPAVNASIIIARKELNNVHIQLSNASGKVVYNLQQAKLSAGGQITVPVKGLPKGMYILKLSSNESKGSEKLIVE